MKTSFGIAAVAALVAGAGSAMAGPLLDGSFENQAVLQNNPYELQPNGEKWGASWGYPNSGWSSWQYNFSGAWVGGAIARTEDFAAGWKRAHTGDVFGIIKDRQTMSQTFTATESGIGTLSWFDANRAAWRQDEWFGRPNDYSVTITDSLGNMQLIGNYSSEVAGGNDYSSPVGDGWWTTEGKSTWFAKSGTGFTMVAGMSYTLSFNSLSPFYDIVDANGNITGVGVDDRSTFLDDISMTVIPTPGTAALLGLGGLLAARRRR
ncbi:hypothetical protein LBMAG48_19600 [Phycisphaerae bacterium]|nr:hypothetical protein LBMAG48_19600 [Phycisphaerae bacterium]